MPRCQDRIAKERVKNAIVTKTAAKNIIATGMMMYAGRNLQKKRVAIITWKSVKTTTNAVVKNVKKVNVKGPMAIATGKSAPKMTTAAALAIPGAILKTKNAALKNAWQKERIVKQIGHAAAIIVLMANAKMNHSAGY